MKSPIPHALLSILALSALLPSGKIQAAGAAESTSAPPSAPGPHKNIPCAKDAKLTFDLYLPKAYAERPKDRLPVLFISGPAGSPGFRGMERWAEEAAVILVVINNSKNGDWAPIFRAQDAVLDSIKELRAHPTLRFATGCSGGGWASLEMAKRNKAGFSGAVLQCHSGGDDTSLPTKSLCFSFIGGLSDTTHPDFLLRAAAARMRKGGLYVQEEHLARGHDWVPADVLARHLDNMLLYARLTDRRIAPEERAAALAAAEKAVASRDEAALARVAPLFRASALNSSPLRSKALEAWAGARLSRLEAMEPEAAAEAFCDTETYDTLDSYRGAEKARLTAFIKKISADKKIAARIAAHKEFDEELEKYVREVTPGSSNYARTYHAWVPRWKKFAAKHAGSPEARIVSIAFK